MKKFSRKLNSQLIIRRYPGVRRCSVSGSLARATAYFNAARGGESRVPIKSGGGGGYRRLGDKELPAQRRARVTAAGPDKAR